MNHPLVDRLQGEHEQIRKKLAGLEETIKLLRQGKPYSGREYVRLGEEFAETMAGHLSRENAAFKELAAASGDNLPLEYPLPTGFRRQKLIGVFSVAEELCSEYLEKQFLFLNGRKRRCQNRMPVKPVTAQRIRDYRKQ